MNFLTTSIYISIWQRCYITYFYIIIIFSIYNIPIFISSNYDLRYIYIISIRYIFNRFIFLHQFHFIRISLIFNRFNKSYSFFSYFSSTSNLNEESVLLAIFGKPKKLKLFIIIYFSFLIHQINFDYCYKKATQSHD